MKDYKYDYFIGGRWRSRKIVEEVLNGIRNAGMTAYCFIDNSYNGDGVFINTDKNADVESFMYNLERLENWQTNPTFRQIFENDMNGIRYAKEALFVFPAGLSTHMEIGAAYGMGKPCFGIGKPEKYETLYLMMNKIYPTIDDFMKERVKVRA